MSTNNLHLHAAAAQVATSLVPSSAPTGKTASTTSTTGSSSSAAGAASTSDISSNDFLTLLVTEMKNQDPTQPTDPNAYIQQLVGVNSLQQLISINQELGTATSGTAAPTGAISSPSSSTPAAPVAATPSAANNL